MKWIFPLLILAAFGFGAWNGNMDALSTAALSECGHAVELAIGLLGSMCLWSGLMQIAKESGLTDRIAALLSPLTKHLFAEVPSHSNAMRQIAMSLTANLLGLGNAATPFGIAAMQELDRINPHPEIASRAMIRFILCSCASLPLFPANLAVLRMRCGAPHPLDVLPAIWATALFSLVISLLFSTLFLKKHAR